MFKTFKWLNSKQASDSILEVIQQKGWEGVFFFFLFLHWKHSPMYLFYMSEATKDGRKRRAGFPSLFHLSVCPDRRVGLRRPSSCPRRRKTFALVLQYLFTYLQWMFDGRRYVYVCLCSCAFIALCLLHFRRLMADWIVILSALALPQSGKYTITLVLYKISPNKFGQICTLKQEVAQKTV